MKQVLLIVFFWGIFIQTIDGQSNGTSKLDFEISSLDNSVFKENVFWRGADGAATIDLENGKILWLFSDTFIDTAGTGKRVGSKMINNTLAIQRNADLQKSDLDFLWKGTNEDPKSFFDLPGDTWFWTGHGTIVNGKLLVFLFEEKSSTEGLGFESVGWTLAIISNPNESPENWKIDYVKGPYDFGVIVGSSAVLKDENFVYTYGVKEPGNHETYLLRFEKNKISNGGLTSMEWWTGNNWKSNLKELPESAKLFEGQTEFSVHFDYQFKKYIQIQTFGFGHASLGFRLADKLQGPWSEPTIFYSPKLQSGEFNYTANAHPEVMSNGILITYNVNNFNFDKLINNENIYFPRLVLLKLND